MSRERAGAARRSPGTGCGLISAARRGFAHSPSGHHQERRGLAAIRCRHSAGARHLVSAFRQGLGVWSPAVSGCRVCASFPSQFGQWRIWMAQAFRRTEGGGRLLLKSKLLRSQRLFPFRSAGRHPGRTSHSRRPHPKQSLPIRRTSFTLPVPPASPRELSSATAASATSCAAENEAARRARRRPRVPGIFRGVRHVVRGNLDFLPRRRHALDRAAVAGGRSRFAGANAGARTHHRLARRAHVDEPAGSIRCRPCGSSIWAARPVPPRWRNGWRGPGRRLFNTYGPTETSVSASLAELKPGGPVTIGLPLPNYGLLVVDEQRRPLPAGEVGELCIFGPGLALGYLGRPDLTAERFVPNPLAVDRRSTAQMYLTGDLARIEWADRCIVWAARTAR